MTPKEALRKILEKFEELAGTQAPLYIYDEYKEYDEAFKVVEKALEDETSNEVL